MIRIQSIKTVSLLDVVKAAGEERGAGNPIWDEVSNHWHGNQVFSNDSVFCYVLPSINGEELSPVQQRIKNICWAGMEDEDTIYFVVSW